MPWITWRSKITSIMPQIFMPSSPKEISDNLHSNRVSNNQIFIFMTTYHCAYSFIFFFSSTEQSNLGTSLYWPSYFFIVRILTEHVSKRNIECLQFLVMKSFDVIHSSDTFILRCDTLMWHLHLFRVNFMKVIKLFTLSHLSTHACSQTWKIDQRY